MKSRSWPRRELEDQSKRAFTPPPCEHILVMESSTSMSYSPQSLLHCDRSADNKTISTTSVNFPNVSSTDRETDCLEMTFNGKMVMANEFRRCPKMDGKTKGQTFDSSAENLQDVGRGESSVFVSRITKRLECSGADQKRQKRIPPGSMVHFSTKARLLILLCILALSGAGEAEDGRLPWTPRKGCHKVGQTRTITIPGCDRIEVLLNACRGQCLSWAIPSPEGIVSPPKFRHRVTSYSHCCRMTEHEEVTYLIRCEGGVRELRFPSALKCDCFDCSHHGL